MFSGKAVSWERRFPEGHNGSLPCRDPTGASGIAGGLTYSPGPHSWLRVAAGPNLRSSDPESDALSTTHQNKNGGIVEAE